MLSDPADRRGYDAAHRFAGRHMVQRASGARARGTEDSARDWSNYDVNAALSAEERMRRAREARATRARVVREEEWPKSTDGALRRIRSAGDAPN